MNEQGIDIYDYDGVWVDSLMYHYERCLQIAKRHFTLKEFLDHHRGNFYESEHNIFEGTNWNDYDPLILDYPELPLIDGIKSYIEKANYHGRISVINSSGHEGMINKQLKLNGLDGCILDVLGKQSHASKIKKFKIIAERHGVNIHESRFFCDTLGDVLEGKKAGAIVIGVAWGYHSAEVLKEGNPDLILNYPSELMELVA